jgi:hypothetical protein
MRIVRYITGITCRGTAPRRTFRPPLRPRVRGRSPRSLLEERGLSNRTGSGSVAGRCRQTSPIHPEPDQWLTEGSGGGGRQRFCVSAFREGREGREEEGERHQIKTLTGNTARSLNDPVGPVDRYTDVPKERHAATACRKYARSHHQRSIGPMSHLSVFVFSFIALALEAA